MYHNYAHWYQNFLILESKDNSDHSVLLYSCISYEKKKKSYIEGYKPGKNPSAIMAFLAQDLKTGSRPNL